MLNLGGGLGARYLADGPASWTSREYAQVLHDAVGDRTVMVEPGRAIAGAAGITVYRVGTIKEIRGVATYVAVDGGMSDNPRPGPLRRGLRGVPPGPDRRAAAARRVDRGEALRAG